MSCAAPLRISRGCSQEGPVCTSPGDRDAPRHEAQRGGWTDRQTNRLISRESLIRASTSPGCSRKTFPCEGSWQDVGSAGNGWGSSTIWGLGLTLKPCSSLPSLLQVPRCSCPCRVRARVPKGCAGAGGGSRALGSRKCSLSLGKKRIVWGQSILLAQRRGETP